MGEPTGQRIAFWFVVVVAALTLATAASVALRRESVQDPVKALYQQFCKRLARVGIRRHAYEGPISFAARAYALRGDLAPSIRAITEVYVDLRYAGPSQGIAVLRRLVRDFRPRRIPGFVSAKYRATAVRACRTERRRACGRKPP